MLLFDSGSEVEGIHTLELNGRTVVLMFEEEDDALRYAGLLAAQDFPEATPEAISREEIELFCGQAGYEAQTVPSGFMPGTAEERLMLAPPEQTSTPVNGVSRSRSRSRSRRLPLRSLEPRGIQPLRPSVVHWRACCEQRR